MKTETTTISTVIAAALGALLSYCVQLVIPLIVLILVMLLDYATGMSKAWIRKEMCSRIGINGILKKLGYIVIVAVAGVMDWLIGYGLQSVGIDYKLPFLFAAIVMIWLIINELISILENVAAMGGPTPPFITKLLAKLKNTVEEKAGADAGDDAHNADDGIDYKIGYFNLLDEKALLLKELEGYQLGEEKEVHTHD